MSKKAAKKPAKKAAKKAAPKAPEPSMGDFLHKVSWNELVAPDVGPAKSFYTKLFGWKAKPFGEGMDYTVFDKDGKPVAGLVKPGMPGVPPHWLPYVTVKNIKASAAKVTKLGGKIVVEPFAVPTVGQIAVAMDTQGAIFGLHCP